MKTHGSVKRWVSTRGVQLLQGGRVAFGSRLGLVGSVKARLLVCNVVGPINCRPFKYVFGFLWA